MIPTPDIVWEQDGTSPLEDDPFVVAARASELGYVLAANSLDFTIEQFTSTRSERRALLEFGYWEGSYITLEGDPVAYPGPSILLPISVEPNAAGDGGAVIEFCDASGPFIITESQAVARYDVTQGHPSTWTLETDPVSGVLEVVDKRGSQASCDASGAPVGRFDPAPERRESIEASDVRAPLTSSD